MKKYITKTFLFLALISMSSVYSQSVDSQLKTTADEIFVTCTEVRFGSHAPKVRANSISFIWSDSKKTARIITDDIFYSSNGSGMNSTYRVDRRLYNGRDVKITASEIEFNTSADEGWKSQLWLLDRSMAILKSYNPSNPGHVFNTYRCIKGSTKL